MQIEYSGNTTYDVIFWIWRHTILTTYSLNRVRLLMPMPLSRTDYPLLEVASWTPSTGLVLGSSILFSQRFLKYIANIICRIFHYYKFKVITQAFFFTKYVDNRYIWNKMTNIYSYHITVYSTLHFTYTEEHPCKCKGKVWAWECGLLVPRQARERTVERGG